MVTENFLQSLFIFALLGSIFSYFIYPMILLVVKKLIANNHLANSTTKANDLPFISVIITAFNEETHIAAKLDNTLEIEYPSDKFEIIVASDGSTDNTNRIVKDYEDRHVRLVPVVEQRGKENAQRQAIQAAKGEILVFSDVTTRIESHALQIISSKFNNPKVGAISSEDRFITENGTVAGEGAYVKYEMWLRNLEGDINSLVGLSGSFFAARREICVDWDIGVPSDFNTALNCIRKGYVAVSEPKLLGFYPNLKDESKEYQRKLRTVIRGIAALFSQTEIMNPFRHGLFSLQIISHKLMRWLVPWFLILTLMANFAILKLHVVYQLTFAIQLVFYFLAIVGWFSRTARAAVIFKIPYFFMQVNIAIAHATLLFLSGKRITQWTPSKR
jgi:glycosyltransferase involved in cell wall biosynthesis